MNKKANVSYIMIFCVGTLSTIAGAWAMNKLAESNKQSSNGK
ncbi:hypothetical protein [Photobacterium damselae]|nr:hypothetical protein [Photobacterium damselae]